MKIIIAGSRHINDPESLKIALKQSELIKGVTEVVSGEAAGADTLGRLWAESNNIKVIKFPVSGEDWKRLGKGAGHIRNQKMANYSDGLILVWDGISKGSHGMKEKAIKKGIPIEDFRVLDCGCVFKFDDNKKELILNTDINTLNLDCKKTWELLGEGNTEGIFQLESHLGKSKSKKLKPENIDHLAALSAVLRPGAMNSLLDDGKSVTDHFIMRKHGMEDPKPFHESLEPILRNTFGLIIYQEQILEISKEIAGFTLPEADVLRKCIAGDSLVFTKNGPQYIKDLIGKKKQYILSLDKNNKLCFNKISEVWSSGQKEVIEIKSSNGFSIKVSEDHEIYTQDGFKTAKNLTDKDFILMPTSYSFKGKDYYNYNDDLMELTGYFLGEGCYTEKSTCKITNSDQWILNRCKKILVDNFGEDSYREYKHKNGVMDIYFKNKAKLWIEQNFQKLKSRNKKIPEFITNSDNGNGILRFIGAIFSGEGDINIGESNHISINSTSLDIIKKLQILLLKYKIFGGISYHDSTYKGLPYKSYRLNICDKKYIALFKFKIGKFICPEKILKINYILDIPFSKNYQSFLVPSCFIEKATKNINIKSCLGRPAGGADYKGNQTYDKAARINDLVGSEMLDDILKSEARFCKIKSIKILEEKEDVYDFSVENKEVPFGFINGILVHNCIGKKNTDLMAEQKDKFINGCKNKGIISEKEAIYLFDNIEKSQKYLFNASHSYSYAYIGYLCAIAKTHFTTRFFRSYLSHAKDKQKPLEEIASLITNARRMNIDICPPDIRRKNIDFTIHNNKIYFGLKNIKEIGDAVIVKILNSIGDLDLDKMTWPAILVKLLDFNITAAKRLIAVGALDFTGLDRNKMLFDHDCIMALSKKEQEYLKNSLNLQDFIGLDEVFRCIINIGAGRGKAISNKKRLNIVSGILNALISPPKSLKDEITQIVGYEESYLGQSLTAHRLDSVQKYMTNITCAEFNSGLGSDNLCIVGQIKRVKEIVDKNDNPMAFITLEDERDTIDSVIVFSKTWNEFKTILNNLKIIRAIGHRGKENSFILTKCVGI